MTNETKGKPEAPYQWPDRFIANDFTGVVLDRSQEEGEPFDFSEYFAGLEEPKK